MNSVRDMKNLVDPSTALLAACGGDTVKLFDVVKPGDPCTLTYAPSPGCLLNCVKWNHTNLVVASAGEDKKISLWRKNGQSLGTIPVAGTDSGDSIEESILAISFSNKGSRYICSGGSGQVVRIWDLQRKRCIKWLKGHTSSITGAMYNCKDEHLASISLNGDLILHNLASSARAAELKDPHQQVLRVLDYSRISRHLLVTAGDDGTVHLWDTTGRNPKVSWLKQHSAPTAGISFSPSNDKIIASIGLDKKLYTYDSGSRKPSSCIAYEAPFSSLAFRDDGWILAAGTSSGRVVFYDVRGKPEPLTVLRAYSTSEAVTSLCWQRSKPVVVNESSCTAEAALLGGAVEDSVLMPDPLPSITSSSLSVSTTVSGSRNTGRLVASVETSSLAGITSGSSSSLLTMASAEETPHRSHLWPGGTLSKLHAPRSSYNFKDDMEVFSPLVDVQPITPSLDKLWDNHERVKKDQFPVDKKPSSMLYPSSRRFPFAEDGANDHPIFDWKSTSSSKQDDNRDFTFLGSSPSPSSKSEDSSITPPEAWGGDRFSDKFAHLHQPLNFSSRFGMSSSGSITSGSMFAGVQDLSSSTSQMSMSSLTNSTLSYTGLQAKDVSSNQDTSLGFREHLSSNSTSLSLSTKNITGYANLEAPGSPSLTLPRRYSTYAERISTTLSLSDGTSLSLGSPKTKKTGAETREELLNSLLSRSDSSAAAESGMVPATNGGIAHAHKGPQSDPQQGSSFSLQLFQRTLEETLDSFQKSIHEDMRNLHIEILRQFHMQEVDMSRVMSSILKNQAELMEEVKSLRKENQQLRQML
ncbi:Transducin/WD40 repeat-like superfamily protein isoform 1 [Tripterygium wilfordii]|uniref:Transducin/WD40 repeat-like superfamily protein isoform 1 n=1 Tax=Tripterygium wilfordii TaxID=458696 RepID=A0A7J7D8L0_TRIWF|nr:protein NEDD1-like isoform X2 [Tripterygium wilfordii]KAF5742700.1 Transducin/WD40 repeat-like superfamily protein isoform 1 [Tripterygium wilfordii]